MRISDPAKITLNAFVWSETYLFFPVFSLIHFILRIHIIPYANRQLSVNPSPFIISDFGHGG